MPNFAPMEKMRINFVLPPSPKISGGPLAILEYASRLLARGHRVSITTYPNSTWDGENPFPWFDFKGDIYYRKDRAIASSGPTRWLSAVKSRVRESGRFPAVLGRLFRRLRKGHLQAPPGMASLIHRAPVEWLVSESSIWVGLIEAMPNCDLNIATLWSTAFPVYFSRKGKPVYFMQHYEEIFYTMEPDFMLHRLAARMSYSLPIYKIANSSWLQQVVLERTGQRVPFSTNGLEIADFAPAKKWSADDGIVRIVTFSRPEQWKGFADAAAAVSKVRSQVQCEIEWHVFGYLHNDLSPDNAEAPYIYHPKLPFKDLADLYARCDIAICASWFESFPLPPLEAMASGTAVVTTRLGTEDYAFDGVNALVVAPRDVDGIVHAVIHLIDDPELRARIAGEGRKTAETYAWEHAVDVRETLLLQIHRGDVDYDLTACAASGLHDFRGRPFEVSGSDRIPERALVSHGGMVFVVVRGVLHHVLTGELLQAIEQMGVGWSQISALDLSTVPRGMAIASRSDFSTVFRS